MARGVLWAELSVEPDSSSQANVCAGEGRVHECLRKHTAQLSEGGRKEELHLMVMQAQVGFWQSHG